MIFVWSKETRSGKNVQQKFKQKNLKDLTKWKRKMGGNSFIITSGAFGVTLLYILTLHRTALHPTVDPYTTSYSPTPFCSSLHYTAQPYTTLYITTLHCLALHLTEHAYTIMYSPTPHCTSLHFTIQPYISLYILTLHHTTLHLTVHNYTTLYRLIS